MEKKYILVPGWITSQTDGDRHFIGASRLAELYGVPMGECVIAGDVSRKVTALEILRPLNSGRYFRHDTRARK